ncbi:MAG: hypothetical protein MASP_00379 [Candidatus Methanolliviera sp. GoM_asphalt]|nr:MAG: hypothetical protein MASP_00379 [Candidatus Methanolliviera sp. GoM_asphalt]
MPERDFKLFIIDIRDCANRILDYTRGKSFEEFIKNQMLIDAVVRNLEIIGEATKNLPDKIKLKYPRIEWRKIAGLRDIVIHGYFRIDYEILWDIIQNKIPDLAIKILEVLKGETEDGR